jgi:steroid delta-isomerase-like uncharacterized protein
MANPSDMQREMLEAWNSRDFDKMRSMAPPQYTYMGADGKEYVGPDAGIEIARMYAAAFPDGRIEVRRIHTAGDVSIAECVARGTHKGELMGVAPTGKPVEILLCNVMEVRGGKIYREREYMDMLALLSQIGAVTAPGG